MERLNNKEGGRAGPYDHHPAAGVPSVRTNKKAGEVALSGLRYFFLSGLTPGYRYIAIGKGT